MYYPLLARRANPAAGSLLAARWSAQNKNQQAQKTSNPRTTTQGRNLEDLGFLDLVIRTPESSEPQLPRPTILLPLRNGTVHFLSGVDMTHLYDTRFAPRRASLLSS
jgi:hypothetical protein